MLKRFEIENIKNFKERFILDFANVRDYQFNTHCVKDGLLKDAIVYGRNAVGKSNLGMALFDIVATLTDAKVTNYRAKFDNFFLNADGDKEYGEFLYAFQLDGTEILYAYRKTDIDTIIAEKFIVDGMCIFDINFDLQGVNAQGLSRIGITSLNQEYPQGEIAFLRYIIKNTYVAEDSILKKLYNFVSGMMWVRSFENNLLIPNGKEGMNVTRFLCDNQLVEEYSMFLNEFGIQNKLYVEQLMDGKNKFYFKHEKYNIPVFESASSGTLALTTLFYAIHLYGEKTFVWLDEFDAFYHFELAENIINYLAKNKDFQLVCTSHNTDLLSNRIMRPDCYFILSENGLVSLPNATDRELREGHNLEKLFQSGEFEDVNEKS